MRLPDAGELLQKDGELLQRRELQTRVLEKLGSRLEKLLTATRLQEGVQVSYGHTGASRAQIEGYQPNNTCFVHC